MVEVPYQTRSENEKLIEGMQNKLEYDQIHPRELSGDENEEQSILATYANNEKANAFMSVTIIIKSIIGAGIISLPFTVSRLGYILAPILLIIFFMINQYSSSMLLKSKNLSRHSNYATIMHYLWPYDRSLLFGSAIIFLGNFGTCMLQFILLKLSIRKIAAEVSNNPDIINNWYLSQYFIVIIVGIVQFPAILIKKIQKLRVFSFIGVAGVTIFFIGVIFLFFTRIANGMQLATMNAFPKDPFQAVSATATLFFAFNFQFNFFPIYKGMKDVTDRKMQFACFTGLLGCAIPYIIVGYLGFAMVGYGVNANFLESIVYSETNPALYFAINIFYLFSLLFAIILLFFGARNNFINIVNILKKKINKRMVKKMNADSGVVTSQQAEISLDWKSKRRAKADREYFILTAFLFSLILICAIFLSNIELIFNFLGAACSSMYVVFLPCMFYITLIRRMNQPKTINYYLAVTIFVVMAPYSLFTIVSSYID